MNLTLRALCACLAYTVLWSTPSAQAIEEGCVTDVLSEILGGYRNGWAGYGERIQLSHYANSKNILLLSDSNFGGSFFSIGDKLARAYPDKMIVQTDIKYSVPYSASALQRRDPQKGVFAQFHIDNTQPFPFESNQFDTVVMRRGLCICDPQKKHVTCAGFCATDKATAQQFFLEVSRVLDKNNPESRAILHGEAGVTPEVIEEWKKYSHEIESKVPVTFRFQFSIDRPAQLSLIEIRPRNR